MYFFLEVRELETGLKEVPTCKVYFPSTSTLHQFELSVTPNSGLYKGGVFKFSINVPPEYNNVVNMHYTYCSLCKKFSHRLLNVLHVFGTRKFLKLFIFLAKMNCFFRNITEDGSICLSLLRENSLDGFGKIDAIAPVDFI